MIDVAPVPERLEDAVSPAKGQDVLHRLLAEIVVDAVDLGFGKDFLQFVAEGAGAVQIVSEWFFDNQAPPAISVRQAGGAEALRGRCILAGLSREIEQHVAAGAPRLFDCGEAGRQLRIGGWIANVARHVIEALRKAGPDVVVEGRIFQVFLDRFAHLFAKLVVGHRCARNAHHGETRREAPLIHQPVQRVEPLLCRTW